MKRFSIIVILAVLFVPSQITSAQDPCALGTSYRNCKACGSAIGPKGQKLNVLKNRDDKATDPEEIAVAAIASAAKTKAFPEDKQVWVTGYVVGVSSGGKEESCNCARSDLRDIHIDIVAKKNHANDLSKHVVVEITPRWQEKFGLDDSDYQKMLKGLRKQILNKWVKFEGWMLYDSYHANQSKSTRPKLKTCPNDGKIHKGCNWRATPWEVHPVTAYTVVSAP